MLQVDTVVMLTHATHSRFLVLSVAVTCGDPGTPSNGARIGDVFTFGSSVSYQCNEGYRISDDASRTCLSDGTWSGTTPTCIGRWLLTGVAWNKRSVKGTRPAVCETILEGTW